MKTIRRHPLALLLALTAALLCLLWLWQPNEQVGGTVFAAPVSLAAPPAIPELTPDVPRFAALPMALIPGGFRSVEDLNGRLAADPVLRAFYGSCVEGRVSAFQTTADRMLYVSFRRGDVIKFASKPRVVPAGSWALARCGKVVLMACGNLTSMMPPAGPTEDVPADALETPARPGQEAPTALVATPSVLAPAAAPPALAAAEIPQPQVASHNWHIFPVPVWISDRDSPPVPREVCDSVERDCSTF
jgi:hypothetical protein